MIGRNVTALTALALFTSLPASAKDYRAERYLVDLNLTQQGVLEVTETVVFHFYGGPFTFVFREIASAESDGITDIRAWIDGTECSRGVSPGDVTIRGEHVRWNFQPVSDTTRTFTVRYRAAGVIRKNADGDTLIWHALPDRRPYPIGASEIRLSYPSGIGIPEVSLKPVQPPTIGSGTAAFQLSDLRSTTDVILTARFAREAFPGPAPLWWRWADARRTALRNGLIFGGAVALASLVGAFIWMSSQRSKWPPLQRQSIGAMPVISPPSALKPALAARLARTRGSIPGVLLGLARRGVVRIDADKPGRFSRTFRIVLQDRDKPLAPHERVLIEGAFGDKDSITLTTFQQRAAGSTRKFSKAVVEELTEAGLFHAGRREVRSRLFLAGTLLAAFAGIAAVLATLAYRPAVAFTGLLAPLAAAALIASVAAFIFGAGVSPLTEAGALEASRWKSFAAYLKEAARGRTMLPSIPDWDRLLPYAAAFTIAGKLVKLARKRGGFTLPEWFGSWQECDDGDFDGFFAFVSAGDASAQSGGDGGGGGGGGGASGGGSSGAG